MIDRSFHGHPFRIAVIAPPWFEIPPQSYGGIESVVYWLARGLLERGHDVTLVGAGGDHTGARFVQTFAEPPSPRLGESFPEVYHAALAARALEGLEFDVVHDHSLAGPLLACGRTIPTVVTAHGPVDGELGDYYGSLGPLVRLVAISDSQREIAPDLPWIRTVHNGIPVGEYPYREAKDDMVLFLGRMGTQKGAHLAIEAARQAGFPLIVAAKCQEPVEVRYYEEEVVPRLGSDVEVLWEVCGDQKKELLGRARCLVFPIQWNEPFGLVMVEALACGTPVVALKGGSVQEILEDGVTGFVCRDVSELAEGIKRANVLEPSACRARAEELFDVPAMVGGYEDAYRLALARAG